MREIFNIIQKMDFFQEKWQRQPFREPGKKELFVSPKAAANDGVDGGKNKSDEQNGEDIQASVVGKEKGKFFSEEEKDDADGKGEE